MSDHVTMVIRFDVAADDQNKLIELMKRSVGEVLSRREGYIDGTIFPSDDGTHVLNVTTWRSHDHIAAVRQDPEAVAVALEMGELATPHPTAYSTSFEFPVAG